MCSQLRTLQPTRSCSSVMVGRQAFWKVQQKNPCALPLETFLINRNAYIYTHTCTRVHAHTRIKGYWPSHMAWPFEGPLQTIFVRKWELPILSWDEYTLSISWCEIHLLSNSVLPHPQRNTWIGGGGRKKSKLRFFTSLDEPTLRLNSHVDNCNFPVACTACSGANVLTFESFLTCSEHDLAQLICTC